MRHTPLSSKHGFTLVELSIVLVILGLLVGGVLAGQSLIRAAELRSVTTEVNSHRVALNAFREKYFGLPGDMTNATAFWGKDNTNCAGDTGTAAANGTCNGNGDGYPTVGAGGGQTGEIFQGWKQLSLAGLVEGNYTGLAGATDRVDYDFGVNSPRSRLPNAGWALTLQDNRAQISPYESARDHRLWFTIGSDDNLHADNPVLTPAEAWNIDTKVDDGKPGRGNVESFYPDCTDTIDTLNFDANYNLGDETLRCALYFKYG